MAVATGSESHNFGNLGCGFVPSSGTQYTYIESVSSNGLQSDGKIEYVVQVSSAVSINNLVWSSAGNISYGLSCGGQSWSTSISKGCNTGTGNCAGGGCCCCNCNGITYTSGWHTFTIRLSPSVTTITASSNWNNNGNQATATYTIPESMRVTNPSGLSVSWPSSLSGGTSMSVSSWGGATPGCYTLQLLSSSGSSLGSTSTCTSYTSSRTLYTPGSYGYNNRYRLKVTACNDANMCVSSTSGYYYTSPPPPSVYINSLLYNPSTQKCVCNWSWSKPVDSGYYAETITYDVYDNEGNYYVKGGSLGTVSNGAAASGTVTTDGILTAVNLCIKVYVATTAGTNSATACAYAPVAGAAFLGFDWDELRRTCTVRATAPGARQTRVSGGYAPNVYSIGSKVTPGEFGDLVVKDLDHGAGEILYLEAMPEATDNHQYLDEVAKISIPIPNPILGVLTPSCEQIEGGEEKKYIVDIIEKKKGSTTCTPRWQNGDRVVVVGECLYYPCFTSIECVSTSANAGFDTATFPKGEYRDFKVVFNAGWDKSKIVFNTSYSNVEWISDDTIRITAKNNLSTANPTFSENADINPTNGTQRLGQFQTTVGNLKVYMNPTGPDYPTIGLKATINQIGQEYSLT